MTGLLKVVKEGSKYVLVDKVSVEEEKEGELQTVFLDGNLVRQQYLKDIRERVSAKTAKS